MCILPNLSAQDLAEASQKRRERIKKAKLHEMQITILEESSLARMPSH